MLQSPAGAAQAHAARYCFHLLVPHHRDFMTLPDFDKRASLAELRGDRAGVVLGGAENLDDVVAELAGEQRAEFSAVGRAADFRYVAGR